MTKILTYLISSVFLSLSFHSGAFARDELAGSADHPKLPRIADSTIVSYYNSDFAEHDFITGYDKKNKGKPNKGLELLNKEGKLTRLVYSLKVGQTPLFGLRNYQEAFAGLGEVKELYTCKKEECYDDLGNGFIWGKDKRIISKEKNPVLDHMYIIKSYHKGSTYWSAEIQSKTANYTVSFYAATIDRFKIKNKTYGYELGQTMVHIDIVETASFKSDLAVVEAAMTN